MKYISAWEINISTMRKEIEKAYNASEVSNTDIVWGGPSGDVVIAASPFEIEGSEYDEYIDRGTVEEYLSD